jgi:hypothetical protein
MQLSCEERSLTKVCSAGHGNASAPFVAISSLPLSPPLLACEHCTIKSHAKPEADPYFRPYRPAQIAWRSHPQ